MRPLTLLLVLSLLANIVFVAFSVRSKGRPFSSSVSSTKVFHSAEAGVATDGATDFSPGKLDAKTWNALQTGDPKTLIDRLRAAGFPPAVIRAIISAQIEEKYAAQRKALLANQKDTPFWQRGLSTYDPKLMADVRELNKQERNELKALLGSDGSVGNEERAAWQRRQFGDLPADKLEQLQAIVSDYGELRSGVYSNANGVLLPEDREKLALIEKEQRTDLAATLTPEELENCELRSSTTANAIRSQLSVFKPTEQEFRALFKATRAAEAQYGTLTTGMMGSDQAEKIRNAVLANLQTQVSPERYAELKQATDPKYQGVNRLVARLDLPASTSVDVVAIQQDIQQRMMNLRRETALPPEQRNAQLAELAQEATNKLTSKLTPRGFEAYKQYGGGWLQSLNPPVRRPAPMP